MTESPSPPEKTPKPKSSPSNPSTKSSTKPSKGGGSWLGGLLWRLVFLGLAGGLGTGLGAALAVVYPDRNPQAPVLDTALRSLGLIGETRVPVSNPLDPNFNNNLNPSSPSPSIVPSTFPTAATTPTPPSSPQTLNQELQQKLAQELQQVQQEARELLDRTASLEQQLGNPNPSSNLETRLDNLAQQLTASPSPITSPPNSSTPTTSSPTSSTGLPTPAIAPSPVTPLNPSAIPLGSNQQKITLPPDTLFDRTTDNNILRPESITLLSQIVNELRGISGTTIQVTAHTNLGGDAARDRILSFQQAKAIREYLATQLGDRFRFVTIGYGNTRPLTTTAAAGSPENRRIEIIVE
ncbi:MAG: OmpA family protein [Coleofasciculaceae cyanobacterium SM2_1_6]|nr:OmpA family protein [Coleofasciculaceae cyanobacterium SM2_1_6]